MFNGRVDIDGKTSTKKVSMKSIKENYNDLRNWRVAGDSASGVQRVDDGPRPVLVSNIGQDLAKEELIAILDEMGHPPNEPKVEFPLNSGSGYQPGDGPQLWDDPTDMNAFGATQDMARKKKKKKKKKTGKSKSPVARSTSAEPAITSEGDFNSKEQIGCVCGAVAIDFDMVRGNREVHVKCSGCPKVKSIPGLVESSQSLPTVTSIPSNELHESTQRGRRALEIDIAIAIFVLAVCIGPDLWYFITPFFRR